MLFAIVTFRGRYRILAISKTKLFVTIVNGFHLFTITAGGRVTSWILDLLLSFLRFVMATYFLLQSTKFLLTY